jgi:DNA-binding MarR family transcriptional regulator
LKIKNQFFSQFALPLTMEKSLDSAALDEGWRLTHMGRLLGHALRRFDERVLELMAHALDVPLALSNLAARGQVGAAHVHITRHLPLAGARLTELAQSAGMSKQAMADLVDQCEAWGLVQRESDPLDARARRIRFTPVGLEWLQAFQLAVQQAEAEFRDQVGAPVATVVAIGLEAYANGYQADRRPPRTRGQAAGRGLK